MIYTDCIFETILFSKIYLPMHASSFFDNLPCLII